MKKGSRCGLRDRSSTIAATQRIGHRADVEHVPVAASCQTIRRVATGGGLGALPGLLIAVVPPLLHDIAVVSSDQAQIGFVGVPLLIIGTFAGTAIAAADRGCGTAALLGSGVGYIVGISIGVMVGTVVVGLAGSWLFVTPIGMIGGAALATYLRLLRADSASAA